MTRPFPWVAPSVLSADFARLGDEAQAVAEADLLHVDVMDGHFVPNLTVGAGVVAALHRVSALPLDVHLMISEPEKYLEEYAAAGAAYLTVHAEACIHLHRTLQRIRALGVKAGVALNPATSTEFLEYVLEETDLVLLMTVNPGFGGQDLIDAVIPKIEKVRRLVEGRAHPLLIEVDGGVSEATCRRLVEAGAQVLVAGSAVFGAPDRAAALAALRRAAGRRTTGRE